MGTDDAARRRLMHCFVQQGRLLRSYSPTTPATGWLVFYIVAETPGITITELKEASGLPMQTVSRLVLRMCGAPRGRRALLRRSGETKDNRKRHVTLAPCGEKLTEELRSIFFLDAQRR